MELMSKFRITYTKWLQTHSRSHEEYQRRKRYNWSIISRIDFNPEPLKKIQIIYSKKGQPIKQLATITIISHNIDFHLKRHVYIFNIEDKSLQNYKFKAVFTHEGAPITIFQINDPVEEIRRKLLNGEIIEAETLISTNDKKDLLVDIVGSLLEKNSILKYQKYRKFPYEIKTETDMQKHIEYNLCKIKQNYIIEFSIDKLHWIIIQISSEKALNSALILSSQCEKLTSLYIQGNLLNDKTIPENAEVLSVFKFFDSQSNLALYKGLFVLKNLIKEG